VSAPSCPRTNSLELRGRRWRRSDSLHGQSFPRLERRRPGAASSTGDVQFSGQLSGTGEQYSSGSDAGFTHLLELSLPAGVAAPSAVWRQPPDEMSCSSTAMAGASQEGDAKGERVVLRTWGYSTLFEVLRDLNQAPGSSCDPMNFAFERLDAGVRQRLDLDTQVCHLLPGSGALMVVRKDAPKPKLLAESLSSCSRRLEKSDVFSGEPHSAALQRQCSAGVAMEYRVEVTVSGSWRSTECLLVVDSSWIYHRDLPVSEMSHLRQLSWLRLPSFARKMCRQLLFRPVGLPELVARSKAAARNVHRDKDNDRKFYIQFGEIPEEVNLVYEAETSAECAEICACILFVGFAE